MLGLIGGEVPAWTLAAVALVVVAAAVCLIFGLIRKIDRRGGELAEGRRRAEDAEKRQAFYRQQLDQRTRGEIPLSPIAQNFIRRIRALRESVQGDLGERRDANDVELDLPAGLISDLRKAVGESRVLDSAGKYRRQTYAGLPDLVTTLNQLEALAMELGQLVAEAERSTSPAASA